MRGAGGAAIEKYSIGYEYCSTAAPTIRLLFSSSVFSFFVEAAAT